MSQIDSCNIRDGEIYEIKDYVKRYVTQIELSKNIQKILCC